MTSRPALPDDAQGMGKLADESAHRIVLPQSLPEGV
jgi:hypothetical protein